MKIILTLLILCLLLPAILAHSRGYKRKSYDYDDEDDKPQYSCRFKTPSRTRYNFERLYKSEGNAYSTSDDQGDTIYFNLCGDLSKLAEGSIGCDPSAAVCVETTVGTFINAGRPNGDGWTQTDIGAVQITYSGGDLCADGSSNYQTTLMLNCTDDDTEENLQVVSVDYSSCQITIQATSRDACPRRRHHYWRGEHHGPGGAVFFFVSAISCCCLTLCCCACIRRRRRMCRQRMQGYQQVPRTEPQNVQIQQSGVQAQLQPYVVPLAVPQQQQQFMMPSQFQYFQPPSYFYPPATTPSAPQVPQANQIPLVDFSQTNDTHIAIRESTIDQDEKLARELQAKFDQE